MTVILKPLVAVSCVAGCIFRGHSVDMKAFLLLLIVLSIVYAGPPDTTGCVGRGANKFSSLTYSKYDMFLKL